MTLTRVRYQLLHHITPCTVDWGASQSAGGYINRLLKKIGCIEKRKEDVTMDGIVGLLLGGFFALLVTTILGYLNLPF